MPSMQEYTFDELVLKIQRKAVMSEGRSKTTKTPLFGKRKC